MTMDNAEPAPIDPVPPVDTDPVQTLAEDLLTKPPKKRRLLSERQKEALRKGREIRWMKKQSAAEEEAPQQRWIPIHPVASTCPDPSIHTYKPCWIPKAGEGVWTGI